MRHCFGRAALPALIGFAPVGLMLLTWQSEGEMSGLVLIVRWLALPVLAVELFVIAVAFRRNLLSAIRRLAARPAVALPAVILLVVSLFTAGFVARNPIAAWIFTILWIIHALYGLSIMHLSGVSLDRRSLTNALLAGFTSFVFLFAVFCFAVPSPAAFNWVNALPAVTNVRFLGFYAAGIVGLCIGRLAAVESHIGWAATLVVATLGLSLSLWTGSRGSLAAVGGALLLGLVLFPALRKRQVLLGVTCSVLLSATIVSTLPVHDAHWGAERVVNATISNDPSSDRVALWRATLSAIAERPLLGHGEAQLSEAISRPERSPHNIILQVLVAWGIVGLACVAIIAFTLLVQVIRTVRCKGGEWLPPAMALTVLAVFSAYDGTFFIPLSLSLAAAYAGMAATDATTGTDA